ncbi:MAG: acyl carrier protein [Lachnospiraceae bacterium]|jgi:acyl carrier protein|nr:acyl carrier protein [Lachnospiraceae bacterium]MBQ1733954.1 acyl carrier protein [Lachnospiraceae bacterium]MCR5390735.1 acyl carrier protein [Lachnospiraceae bacterium]
MTTFEKVRELIVSTLNYDADEIKEDTKLMEDLGADSLDLVELNMALEEKYGISIPEEDFPSLTSVDKIAAYLDEHLPA